jgi:hypothetical protein
MAMLFPLQHMPRINPISFSNMKRQIEIAEFKPLTLAQLKLTDPNSYIVGKEMVKLGEYKNLQAWLDDYNKALLALIAHNRQEETAPKTISKIG